VDKLTDPVVVVGTGLAGYSLVRELRKSDKKTRIIMVTDDDGVSYSKPMLSNGFAKGKTADELAMATPGQMVEQLRIEVRTFCKVTGIVPAQHQLMLGSETLTYGKLVLALGADVISLDLQGTAAAEVLSVNNLTDYRRLRLALEGKYRVAILGAGLIGCEFANDLRLRGFDVDIIAPCQSLLPGLLPDVAAKSLQTGLENIAVKFHLGRYAREVNAAESGLDIILDNQQIIKADVVLSAVGLRPRISLAKQAGLRCGTGIEVNRQLATSAEDVYALGDCAQVDGHSLLYVMPLMACAKALARTLAGEASQVSYGVMPVTVKTPAMPVVACAPAAAIKGEWQTVSNQSDGVAARCISADGRVTGFALTGNWVAEKQAYSKQVSPIHQRKLA